MHVKHVLFSLLQITKLKIDSNPFAKGFRDSSRLTEFERWVSVSITSNTTFQTFTRPYILIVPVSSALKHLIYMRD